MFLASTTPGWVAFAGCLERYLPRRITRLGKGLLLLAAAGLFWLALCANVEGGAWFTWRDVAHRVRDGDVAAKPGTTVFSADGVVP